MFWSKRVLIWVAVIAVVGVLLGVAAFAVMTVKDQAYVPSAAYAPVGEPNSDVAVVYYSRSGHSEAVAREVARMFNSPIARIDADYALDMAGQEQAVSDANAEVIPAIVVEPVDLGPVRQLFLVSPTWMFRPATPLWAYVEQTDLTGKNVVLITTGNSRFKQAETDAFAKRVEARGGNFTRHIFLRRGRIYWQQSREELLHEAREQLSEFSDLKNR